MKNGAGGIISMIILAFILGALTMYLTNVYFINPYWEKLFCGPPAPIIYQMGMDLIDYDCIQKEGDKYMFHGSMLIQFIDTNSLPEGLQ